MRAWGHQTTDSSSPPPPFREAAGFFMAGAASKELMSKEARHPLLLLGLRKMSGCLRFGVPHPDKSSRMNHTRSTAIIAVRRTSP